MTDFFTPKQKELIYHFKHGELKRINLLEGSVRSGKTWISLILWALWVATMPENESYLMVGKTMTALKRNCLEPLKTLIGENNFDYSFSGKEGKLFDRKVYLEGVNDVRAEGKIRGLTLAGAYGDEVTLFTEDFFTMLLSRLSVKGAKFIGTTNPDNPYHWLLKKYIERQEELNMFSMRFLLDDNTTLDPEYIESIKKEYTGVYYDRFILGQWKPAEGLIYDMFDNKRHVISISAIEEPLLQDVYISCDYGTQNATVFLRWQKGKSSEKWYCLDEYYYSGRDKEKQKTDLQYTEDLGVFLKGCKPKMVIVDPAAASFIAQLRQKGYRVKRAKNDVVDGIRFTGALLAEEKMLFADKCKNTIKEFSSYIWDEKASQRGEDKPVKENDHAMDAVRYFAYTVIRKHRSGIGFLE